MFRFFSFFLLLSLAACTNSEQDTSRQDDLARQHAEVARELHKTAITDVLQQDVTVSTNANGDYSRIAAAMRAIDLTQCPPDFAAAFVDHTRAWEEAAEIQSALSQLNSDNNVKDVFMTTFLQKLFGAEKNAFDDAMELYEKLKAEEVKAGKRIHDTYYTVRRIAVTYGAALPNQSQNL